VFLGAGLAGVVGVYAGTRMLPSATAATSTGPQPATGAFAVTNLVANPSFEVGGVSRTVPSWTIG
jgi:hypothetical protein